VFCLLPGPALRFRPGPSLLDALAEDRERGLSQNGSGFRRYHIESREAPDLFPHPSRFRVRVKKHRLVAMVLHELLFEYRRQPQVALSRPCVYGVFGRIVGGLWPRHELCVGCLRCTTQYPGVVQIVPNARRLRLGDAYLTPDLVDTILYEARLGRVPVRGAGYRGAFGGEGWDGMWTDMSEIVRPTRDGIHGREFISTSVDLGGRPPHLRFDDAGQPLGPLPQLLSLDLPYLFDVPPDCLRSAALGRLLTRAAQGVRSLAILPLADVIEQRLEERAVAPLLGPAELDLATRLSRPPLLLELDGWNGSAFRTLTQRFPETVVTVRLPLGTDLVSLVREGVRSFHVTADYHGQAGGRFVMDLIREAHESLVTAGVREEVSLVGSGGIVAAEHVPKAILSGLDAVAIDTALWVALQARFAGEIRDRRSAQLSLPAFPEAWGAQRLANLVAAWRDQLLEILGAMGLREVRRLRGESGRCMFQRDLEAEAYAGIEGYVS